MSDLISRQAAIDEAFEVDTKEYGRIEVVGVDAIEALPPVTPQPKTGHWIDIDGGVECDKCGKWYPHAPIAKNEIKFCSECGAKMVEPQERSDKE